MRAESNPYLAIPSAVRAIVLGGRTRAAELKSGSLYPVQLKSLQPFCHFSVSGKDFGIQLLPHTCAVGGLFDYKFALSPEFVKMYSFNWVIQNKRFSWGDLIGSLVSAAFNAIQFKKTTLRALSGKMHAIVFQLERIGRLSTHQQGEIDRVDERNQVDRLKASNQSVLCRSSSGEGPQNKQLALQVSVEAV
jgi:hypothetical protein